MAEKAPNKDHGRSLGVPGPQSTREHLDECLEAYRLDWLAADGDEVGGAGMAVPVEWMRTFQALERAHRAESPGEVSDRLMALPEDAPK